METSKGFFKTEITAPLFIGREKQVFRYLIAAQSGYFPVLNRLRNSNTLVVVYRDGDIHVGQRGYLRCARSEDEGRSWNRGGIVAAEGMDIRNPAVGITENNTILIAYVELDSYQNGEWLPQSKNQYNLYCRKSTDLGESWSEPVLLANDGHLFSSPYGRITLGIDGKYLMNIYGLNGSYLARSVDGINWGDYSLISPNFNETALITLRSGKMLAVLRHNDRELLNLWLSSSDDGGYQWSEPQQLTGKFQHPADLLELDNGNILLTFGHRQSPFGIRGVISRDQGASWDFEQLIILTADAASTDCGYPSTVQLSDGSLYTAYYADSSLGRFKYTSKYEVGLHAAGIKYRID